MSTINRLSAARKNTNIGGEYARGLNGSRHQAEEAEERAKKGFSRKPKSDVTKAREAAELRTNRRSNWCPTCHITLPTGTKVCDTCD